MSSFGVTWDDQDHCDITVDGYGTQSQKLSRVPPRLAMQLALMLARGAHSRGVPWPVLVGMDPFTVIERDTVRDLREAVGDPQPPEEPPGPSVERVVDALTQARAELTNSVDRLNGLIEEFAGDD